MSYDQHDRFRDRLNGLPLHAGRRGIAAMVLVEIVRWTPDDGADCSKTAEDLSALLKLRPGDVLMALRTLEAVGVIVQLRQGSTIGIRLIPMTPVKTAEQRESEIAEAIAGHSAWKRRLRHAIDTGRADCVAEDVADEHRCPFGQWLEGPSVCEADRDEPYEAVRHLHTQFHRVAAATLQLALSSRKDEAERAMGPGGAYTRASLRLTTALTGWRRTRRQ